MNCNHEDHHLIHDHSSGDKICTGCGTVLESFSFEDQFVPHEESTYTENTPLRKEFVKPSQTIRTMGHLLRLPDSIVSTAITLFLDASAAGLRTRQSTLNAIAASALYYACKIGDVDRAEIEITSNCGVTTKQLAISNKHFRRALASSPWAARIYAPANPVRLIPRFMDALCSDPPVIRREDKHRIRSLSEDIGRCAGEHGSLEGKTPECCCITFIYKALRDLQYPETILGDVCMRCGMTPNTIGNAMTIVCALKM